MYEDEPVNEYRIKVTVRNNLILNAIENAGYRSVSDFCRAVNLPKTALTELIAMRKPPLNQSGEFSENAKALMEELCALPTDLWTSEQLTLKLKRNTAQRDVSSEGMRAALGMHAEEMLELMRPDDPDEAVLKQEMVAVVEEQLESLSPRESKILRMRFGIGCEERTGEEIGNMFGLTKTRILQIEAKALHLIGSAVLRWEYRPGSTIFLVWQRQQQGDGTLGDFDFGRDVDALWSAPADNRFMLKMNYWLGL